MELVLNMSQNTVRTKFQHLICSAQPKGCILSQEYDQEDKKLGILSRKGFNSGNQRQQKPLGIMGSVGVAEIQHW